MHREDRFPVQAVQSKKRKMERLLSYQQAIFHRDFRCRRYWLCLKNCSGISIVQKNAASFGKKGVMIWIVVSSCLINKLINIIASYLA